MEPKNPEKTHTPTPWYHNQTDGAILDAKGCYVLNVKGQIMGQGDVIKKILDSVNAYAPTQEIIGELVAKMRAMMEQVKSGTGLFINDPVYIEAEAAIEKAKSKSPGRE